jgi:hypothetical protein
MCRRGWLDKDWGTSASVCCSTCICMCLYRAAYRACSDVLAVWLHKDSVNLTIGSAAE